MCPGDILKYPWWALSIATGAKNFSRNKLIGSPALNEKGLHRFRVKLASALADSRRKRLRHLVSAEDAAAFERDGFILKRDLLPAEEFEQLRNSVRNFTGTAREMLQGDTITRRMALDPDALARMPAVRDLLNRPDWRGRMRYVSSTGQEPLYYIQTILSHVRDTAPDPQTALHADTFHPTVKAWFFLTDVAEDEGPFVYVPGSHKASDARLNWEHEKSMQAATSGGYTARGSFRITPAEIESMGLPPAQAFAVPANTLVVADTFGFHARGFSARPTIRVEIWAYNRRNPFIPWNGFDILSLPGLAERRIPALWRIRDLAGKCGFRGNPWRDKGIKSPFDGP